MVSNPCPGASFLFPSGLRSGRVISSASPSELNYRATTARTAFTLAFAHPAQRGVYNSSSREELASPSFLRKTPSAHCASFVLVQSRNTSNHGQRRGTRGADFLLVFAGVCRFEPTTTRLEIKFHSTALRLSHEPSLPNPSAWPQSFDRHARTTLAEA